MLRVKTTKKSCLCGKGLYPFAVRVQGAGRQVRENSLEETFQFSFDFCMHYLTRELFVTLPGEMSDHADHGFCGTVGLQWEGLACDCPRTFPLQFSSSDR